MSDDIEKLIDGFFLKIFDQQPAKPWEETDVWKNESQYLTWLRGQFRKIWMDFIPKNEFLSENCRPVNDHERSMYGLHPRTKKAGKCTFCSQILGKSKLQVDHITPAGSMRTYAEAPSYLLRLLCSKDNMQLICKPCHEIKTYADKHEMTFEDATKEKAAIAFSKRPLNAQRSYLQDVLGLKLGEIKNAKMRREAYRKSLD